MSVNLTPNVNPSSPTVQPVVHTAATGPDNLFVANLSSISLEELVKRRLEVHFQQQSAVDVDAGGLKLYDVVLQQVEKPLLELALRATNGNQVKTAQMLGINRNTLKKKIDSYKIRVKRLGTM
ncbi:MAG: site-specific inversion stimulation factor [Pseudomonadota bacterium]|jgi:Fis family transcriptional regulator